MSKWRIRPSDIATGFSHNDSRLHADTFAEITEALFGQQHAGSPKAEQICRLAYSLAARRAFASLFDTDEEDHDRADGIVTLHHFKKVFRSTYDAAFALWPVAERPNTDEVLNHFYDVVIRAGLVWHKPDRVASPRFSYTVLGNEAKTKNITLTRGIGPGIDTRMSGALPWIPGRDGTWPTEAELNPTEYFGLSSLSPRKILDRCVCRITKWTPHRPNEAEHWEYLAPYHGKVFWRPHPEVELLTLARLTRETNEKEYFLLSRNGNCWRETYLSVGMTRLIPELKIGLLLFWGGTPSVQVSTSIDGLTHLEWRILPPLPLRNVFSVASFPMLSSEKPTPYRQTVALEIYEVLRPYLLQAGFRTEIQ